MRIRFSIISSSQGYYKQIADTPALLKNPDSSQKKGRMKGERRG
jgi:hypothetical protein